MDYEETMVENEDFDTEADDTLPEDVEVETDESETESLDSIVEEDEEESQEHAAEPETPSASEPGWIKQRVNKAVEKAVRETEARMQAMFDQQMAPIREKMLNDEAKELVRQGEFKSLDRAKEYLQLKQGLPTTQPQAPAPQQTQPRNDQGQFAPKQDAGTSTRVDMLAHQADAIKADTGLDVIDVFTNDEDIKQRVISGELDFYDVAKMMQQSNGRKRPPAPMRSPNGASGSVQPNAIQNMSDEQFARMEKKIREGARISLR